MIKRFIALILCLSLTSPSWGAYSWYRQITVSHTMAPSNQTSFPMLICANGASPCNTSVVALNQSGGGAHVQNANGYDIGFFTDNTCTTKVTAWEVEDYVASTGELEAWVNDGTFSSSADTIFYMCYGDGSINTFQSTVSNVWDSNFQGVWHEPNGSSLNSNDSTSNAINFTPTSISATAAQIDGGASFNGTTSKEYATATAITNATFSAWINLSALPGSTDLGAIILGMMADTSDASAAWSGELGIEPSGKIVGYVYDGATKKTESSTILSIGAWYFVSYVQPNGGSIQVYINGSADGTPISVGSIYAGWSTAPFYVNSYETIVNSNGFTSRVTGVVDELRVSNIARSADWVKTDYNNQSAPATYVTFGTETAIGGGTVAGMSKRSKLERLED